MKWEIEYWLFGKDKTQSFIPQLMLELTQILLNMSLKSLTSKEFGLTSIILTTETPRDLSDIASLELRHNQSESN